MLLLKHMKILSVWISVFFAGVMLVALVPQVFAATTNVSITSTGFLPESITIKAGDTVVWTNNDTTDHTATDDQLTWDTDVIAPTTTGSQLFATAGSFTYSDTIDPTLTGTITVSAAAGTTTATPTPTPATTKGGTPTTPVSGTVETTIGLLIAGTLLLGGGFFARRFA